MRSTRIVPALTAGAFLLAACGNGSTGDTAIDAAPTEASAPAEAAEATTAPDTEPTDAGTDAPTTVQNDEPAPATAAPTAPATADDGAAAPAALQFSAPLVGGGEIDVAALAGKPTVFWFWAPT